MRTNKVENIIKTLKDSLGCLRDLYCDDSSNLRQSDLLLSGRLMQQVKYLLTVDCRSAVFIKMAAELFDFLIN